MTLYIQKLVHYPQLLVFCVGFFLFSFFFLLFFGDMAQMKEKNNSTITLYIPHHEKETKNFVLKKKKMRVCFMYNFYIHHGP